MDDDEDLAPVATLTELELARELHALLIEAGLSATLEGESDDDLHPGRNFLIRPLRWVVLVPVADVPVALGVADRLLPWFGGAGEGDATLDECLAELGERSGAAPVEAASGAVRAEASSTHARVELWILAFTLAVLAVLVWRIVGA